MAKTFEFSNTNYIKKYPELFLECLKEAIVERTGAESIDLKQYLTPTEIKKIKTQDARIFANVSLIDKSIPIPLLSENFKLKKEMHHFLEIAHESVKSRLSALRKSGNQPVQKETPKKSEKQIVFDPSKERELLTELSKKMNNPVSRHFLYIDLQNFYYRYRAIGEEYINKCIKYCVLDINSLSELQAAYITEEVLRLKQLSSYYDAKDLNDSINRVRQQGFVGNIPAFSRLAIIYEKQKEFQKAIEICDKAIKYGQSVEEFEERKIKLQMKT
jgi:tetratricopeptide (TPR) repeat protein